MKMADPAIGKTHTPLQPNRGQPWVMNERFSSFDELAKAIEGWDLDFRQLDSGPLSAEILQVGAGAALLTRARFSRRFHQRGESPPGLRTFGLIERGVTDVTWCGRELGESSLAVFHPEGEFDAVSAPGFGCYTLSYAEDHLASIAEHLGLPEVGNLVGDVDTVAINEPDDMAELRRLLDGVCVSVTNGDGPPPLAEVPPDITDALELEIPGRVLSALAGSSLDMRRPPARLRDLAVKRAVSFVEANEKEAVTVEQLCDAAGVSWRTLDYAFREQFEITPKAYVKSVRLNAAFTGLRLAPSDTKVADVANRCGFWHMGQFAADYRKQFGELPSATLRRALPS